MSQKTWFITGTSRGLGRYFAEAALERGDKVAATARRTETLDDLVATYGDAVLPLKLDVTDREQVDRAVAAAHERFGRLDVVVNNAGYGLFGTVEEITEKQLRDQMETNFFGAFFVTRAALPVLRAQGSGHIVQISTVGGIGAFPMLSGYHASKWALEGMTESLAQEVAIDGIKVTLVEPGGFSTDWSGSSAVLADPRPESAATRKAAEERLRARMGQAAAPGDPRAAGQALLKVVDARRPPLRVLFGARTLQLVSGIYEERLGTWKEWEELSVEAGGGQD